MTTQPTYQHLTDRPIALRSTVEIHVLGPVECRVGGVEIRLPPILRSVVAALVVRRGVWTPTASLIELVWPGELVPQSPKTLHSHISRLRSLLGADGLLSRGTSYRLDATLLTLDIDVFDRGLGELERQQIESNDRLAAGRAVELLGLWRGRPYEDADAGVPAGELIRLQEAHRRLNELRVRALLQRGDFAEAVAVTESVLSLDPLRETSWAHLMTALHESGRTADALHAYGRARRALAELLGIEPGPALRMLEGQILRGESLRRPLPEPAAPVTSVLCGRPMTARFLCALPAIA